MRFVPHLILGGIHPRIAFNKLLLSVISQFPLHTLEYEVLEPVS